MSYPGFDACLVQRARLKIVPVQFEDPLESLRPESLAHFEPEIQAAKGNGIKVRAIASPYHQQKGNR